MKKSTILWGYDEGEHKRDLRIQVTSSLALQMSSTLECGATSRKNSGQSLGVKSCSLADLHQPTFPISFSNLKDRSKVLSPSSLRRNKTGHKGTGMSAIGDGMDV